MDIEKFRFPVSQAFQAKTPKTCRSNYLVIPKTPRKSTAAEFFTDDYLEVSINTVRTHLKRIFVKTGTDRQADLVQIILTGVHIILTPEYENGHFPEKQERSIV